MKQPTIYVWEGEHFVVRRIGTGPCLLARHSGAPLDRFQSETEAILVAQYCDARGGSYAAPIRREAKAYAKAEMELGRTVKGGAA